MIETWEFRVDAENAGRLFEPDEGKYLGDGSVRRITLSPTDPRLPKMRDLQSDLVRHGDFLYAGWSVHRRYSLRELREATLLRIVPTCFFEPVGEECGTVYEEEDICSMCRAGRRQVSSLILKTSRIPKRADVAATIAQEWVWSRRLAELVRSERISGVDMRPVLSRAKARNDRSPDWVQPVATSSRVQVDQLTEFGVDPLDRDVEGKYRCSCGAVLGLNIVSELHISRSSWRGEDFVQTEQMEGLRTGVLVPHPFFLVSQRFYQVLVREKIRGFRVEVTHLEPAR